MPSFITGFQILYQNVTGFRASSQHSYLNILSKLFLEYISWKVLTETKWQKSVYSTATEQRNTFSDLLWKIHLEELHLLADVLN